MAKLLLLLGHHLKGEAPTLNRLAQTNPNPNPNLKGKAPPTQAGSDSRSAAVGLHSNLGSEFIAYPIVLWASPP